MLRYLHLPPGGEPTYTYVEFPLTEDKQLTYSKNGTTGNVYLNSDGTITLSKDSTVIFIGEGTTNQPNQAFQNYLISQKIARIKIEPVLTEVRDGSTIKILEQYNSEPDVSGYSNEHDSQSPTPTGDPAKGVDNGCKVYKLDIVHNNTTQTNVLYGQDTYTVKKFTFTPIIDFDARVQWRDTNQGRPDDNTVNFNVKRKAGEGEYASYITYSGLPEGANADTYAGTYTDGTNAERKIIVTDSNNIDYNYRVPECDENGYVYSYRAEELALPSEGKNSHNQDIVPYFIQTVDDAQFRNFSLREFSCTINWNDSAYNIDHMTGNNAAFASFIKQNFKLMDETGSSAVNMFTLTAEEVEALSEEDKEYIKSVYNKQTESKTPAQYNALSAEEQAEYSPVYDNEHNITGYEKVTSYNIPDSFIECSTVNGKPQVVVKNLFSITKDGTAKVYSLEPVVQSIPVTNVASDPSVQNPTYTDYSADTYRISAVNSGVRSNIVNKVYQGGELNMTLTGSTEFEGQLIWKDNDTEKKAAREAAVANGTAGNFILYRYVDKDGHRELISQVGTWNINNQPLLDENNQPVTDSNGNPIYKIRYEYTYVDESGNTVTTYELDKYDTTGAKYYYLAKERLELDEYGVAYSGVQAFPATYNGDPVFPNGGIVTNKLTSELEFAVDAKWIAADLQGGTAEITYRLQRKNANGEWEYVSAPDAQNGNGILRFENFSAEVMEKKGIFNSVPKYDDEGTPYEYQIVQTHVKRKDNGAEGQDDVERVIPLTVEGAQNNPDPVRITINGHNFEITRTDYTDPDTGRRYQKFEYRLVGDQKIIVNKDWAPVPVSQIQNARNAQITFQLLIYNYTDGKYYPFDENHGNPGGLQYTDGDKENGVLVVKTTGADDKTGLFTITRSCTVNDDNYAIELINVPRYDEFGHANKFSIRETAISPQVGSPIYSAKTHNDGTEEFIAKNVFGDGGESIDVNKVWMDDGEAEYKTNVRVEMSARAMPLPINVSREKLISGWENLSDEQLTAALNKEELFVIPVTAAAFLQPDDTTGTLTHQLLTNLPATDSNSNTYNYTAVLCDADGNITDHNNYGSFSGGTLTFTKSVTRTVSGEAPNYTYTYDPDKYYVLVQRSVSGGTNEIVSNPANAQSSEWAYTNGWGQSTSVFDDSYVNSTAGLGYRFIETNEPTHIPNSYSSNSQYSYIKVPNPNATAAQGETGPIYASEYPSGVSLSGVNSALTAAQNNGKLLNTGNYLKEDNIYHERVEVRIGYSYRKRTSADADEPGWNLKDFQEYLTGGKYGINEQDFYPVSGDIVEPDSKDWISLLPAGAKLAEPDDTTTPGTQTGLTGLIKTNTNGKNYVDLTTLGQYSSNNTDPISYKWLSGVYAAKYNKNSGFTRYYAVQLIPETDPNNPNHLRSITFQNSRIGVVNYKVTLDWNVGSRLNEMEKVTVKIKADYHDGHAPQYVTVPVDPNDPNSQTTQEITLEMLKNDNDEMLTNEYYITNLPKYTNTGAIITYTIEEVKVNDHTFDNEGRCDLQGDELYVTYEDQDYQVNQYSNSNDIMPIKITNTFKGSTTCTVNKLWKDDTNALKTRSDLYIRLYQHSSNPENTAVDPQVEKDYLWERNENDTENYWNFTYDGLGKYDSKGYRYEYYVKEVTSNLAPNDYVTFYDNVNHIHGTATVEGGTPTTLTSNDSLFTVPITNGTATTITINGLDAAPNKYQMLLGGENPLYSFRITDRAGSPLDIQPTVSQPSNGKVNLSFTVNTPNEGDNFVFRVQRQSQYYIHLQATATANGKTKTYYSSNSTFSIPVVSRENENTIIKVNNLEAVTGEGESAQNYEYQLYAGNNILPNVTSATSNGKISLSFTVYQPNTDDEHFEFTVKRKIEGSEYSYDNLTDPKHIISEYEDVPDYYDIQEQGSQNDHDHDQYNGKVDRQGNFNILQNDTYVSAGQGREGRAYDNGIITNKLENTVVINGEKLWQNIISDFASTDYPIADVFLYANIMSHAANGDYDADKTVYANPSNSANPRGFDDFGYAIVEGTDSKDKSEALGELMNICQITGGTKTFGFSGSRKIKTVNGSIVYYPGDYVKFDDDINTLRGEGTEPLQKYDENGALIDYQMMERAINGYTYKISDDKIINEYNGGENVQVKVTKEWENMTKNSVYPTVKLTLHQAYVGKDGSVKDYQTFVKQYHDNELNKTDPNNARIEYTFGAPKANGTYNEELHRYSPTGGEFFCYLEEELIDANGSGKVIFKKTYTVDSQTGALVPSLSTEHYTNNTKDSTVNDQHSGMGFIAHISEEKTRSYPSAEDGLITVPASEAVFANDTAISGTLTVTIPDLPSDDGSRLDPKVYQYQVVDANGNTSSDITATYSGGMLTVVINNVQRTVSGTEGSYTYTYQTENLSFRIQRRTVATENGNTVYGNYNNVTHPSNSRTLWATVEQAAPNIVPIHKEIDLKNSYQPDEKYYQSTITVNKEWDRREANDNSKKQNPLNKEFEYVSNYSFVLKRQTKYIRLKSLFRINTGNDSAGNEHVSDVPYIEKVHDNDRYTDDSFILDDNLPTFSFKVVVSRTDASSAQSFKLQRKTPDAASYVDVPGTNSYSI